jgi:MFS family permease
MNHLEWEEPTLSTRTAADESTPFLKRRTTLASSSTKLKWHVLTLCCFIMSVMYYILAMPAALHNALFAVMPNTNFEMNFNMLFTISYVPNMILPLLGGAIVDRYGQTPCLVVFALTVGLGQLLATVGAYFTNWEWLLAGRLIFGLGAQNLIVANASLISKYFAGKEGVALGLSNVCSYAGVIATNMLSPVISNWTSPTTAFGTSVILQVFAVGMAAWVVILDQQCHKDESTNTIVCSPMYSPIAYRRLSSRTHSTDTSSHSGPTGVICGVKDNQESTEAVERSGLSKLRDFKPTFWLLCLSFLLIYGVVWSFTNVSSGILLERDFFLTAPSSCSPQYPNQCTSGTLASEEGNPWKFTTTDCPVGDNFAPPIPSSLNVTVRPSNGDDNQISTPFNNDQYIFGQLHDSDIKCQDAFWSQACTMEFCERQALATEKAGFYMSIPYFFTVALTFHLGLFVDATGYRTELICFGSLLLVISHAILAYPATAPPTIPLVTQGLGYTICVAALWPSVPFTVKDDSVGLAFGIMMAVQNVGLAVIPMIVAKLYAMGDNQYLPMVEIFFALCSFCAVVAGLTLMISDRRTGKILASPKRSIRFDQKQGSYVVNRRPRSTSDDKIPYDFAMPI